MVANWFNRTLPPGLEGLWELALDLRWTWSHATDKLWAQLDPEVWEHTQNPFFILQSVSQGQLERLGEDDHFKQELQKWLQQRQQYLHDRGWFGREWGTRGPNCVAYFCMEFGLGEALSIYSGGLGILAGDFLKAASDLGVPVIGIGLLYQQGYFRQILYPDGRQGEVYPYNDPATLPITPVQNRDGGWLRLRLELPGRPIMLRVWQAEVGKAYLYLLDSNDPLNHPPDRGATAQLYPSEPRSRLLQQIILGIGGWRILEELGIPVDVCHLNEGHAAFAVLARALGCMRQTGQSFSVAFRATRAGNVFTTHTPVEAAFDRFSPELVRPYISDLAAIARIPADELLALGRHHPEDANEPFNMTLLAMRGSGLVNGVSRLHGMVSRDLFQPLFPRWPREDVPVTHITNGVHVPTWDSQEADTLWTNACGKSRWLGTLEDLCSSIAGIRNEELWLFRAAQRYRLIRYARRRLARQMQERGVRLDQIRAAEQVLDPDALTLGFARRFAEYKRPNLILHDSDRLAQLLCSRDRPLQLIVAGKAHPHDEDGKRLVHAMTSFAARPDVWNRIIFLEDYDISLAQYLVAGIDVWLNTPRRPWEACGTSGMKVLVNGGLNCSERDGWWAEAYAPEVGWTIGDGREHPEPAYDAVEAADLYEILEHHIIPEFYDRDPSGIPHRWLARIRSSMSRLTPQFSSNRMVREYVETLYGPALAALNQRLAHGGKLAVELDTWHTRLQDTWSRIRFGTLQVTRMQELWRFDVQVYFGACEPDDTQVELYADSLSDRERPVRIVMRRHDEIAGSANGYRYQAECSAARPAHHFTPRIVPFHSAAMVPLEEQNILWLR